MTAPFPADDAAPSTPTGRAALLARAIAAVRRRLQQCRLKPYTRALDRVIAELAATSGMPAPYFDVRPGTTSGDWLRLRAEQQARHLQRRQRRARRWDRWTVHNLLGHPLSELAHLVGLDRMSTWLHDVTVPAHEEGTGRG